MILLYADGHFNRGYGHLYRLKALKDNFLKNSDYLFLSNNKMQQNFYNKNSLKSINLADYDYQKKYELIIVDTKQKNINFLKPFLNQNVRSIAIDTTLKWNTRFNCIVYPSFYVDDDIKYKSLNQNVYFGREYSLIREDKVDNSEYSDILITFGGTDPNNLTQIILDNTKKLSSKYKITSILGPGFTNKLEDLKYQFPKINFVGPVKSTFDYIANSGLIITAFGTTIEEVEFLNKPCIMCFNYQQDIEYYDKVIEHSINPKLWSNIGSYNNIKIDFLLEEIERLIDIKDINKTTKKKPTAGKELLRNSI